MTAYLAGQNTDFVKLSDKIRKLRNDQKFDSAMYYSDSMLLRARQEGSKKYIISAFSSKANIYHLTGDTKKAIDFYYKALKNCTDTSFNKQKIFIYNNLGIINFEQKNISLAKFFFKEEIKVKRNANMLKPLANSLLNLSSVHRSLKEYDSSAIVLNELSGILPYVKDSAIWSFYYNAFGMHYQLLYRQDSIPSLLDSAASNYNRALFIWNKTNNMAEAFRPLFNLGAIYQTKQEYGKALYNYLLALRVTDSLELKEEKNKILGNLSELYFDLKDYKRAAETFRAYIELKDQLQAQEINAYAIQLDKQYQTERSKETIQKQNLEIAEQNLRIERQGKRIYLILFILVIIVLLTVLLIVYFGFKKRVNSRIEEAKRKFFSNVVHEIRTPLSMIQAPLKVLKSKHNDDDDRFNIEVAERNINRLNDLVNQMLSISKLDAVKYTLNETLGDLDAYLNQIVQGFVKAASDQNIVVHYSFNITQKMVLFDKDAIEKIVGNLLSNAIKFTQAGGQVGIDVTTRDDENGVLLDMIVWDTGEGIPLSEQSKIFDRFFRSKQNSDKTKGAGIGLSLVKDLLELLRGEINVKSEPGKGATFTVKMMLNLPMEIRNDITGSETNSTTQEKPVILLVEDDDEILRFNSHYLRNNGFSVLTAKNGNEALLLIEKTLPDLMITDLMMPELDGMAMLKSIRSNENTNHIPVIVLSAKASGEARIAALNEGAQAHLTKPFLPDELLAIVKNQIDILRKRKLEFNEQIHQTEKSVEERYTGKEPYTQKLFKIIFQQFDNPELTVESLADLMATNRSHFQRKVKAMLGISPSELIRTIRLEKARELLLKKQGNVTEIAYQTGFSSQSYFTKCFTQHFGVSPSQVSLK